MGEYMGIQKQVQSKTNENFLPILTPNILFEKLITNSLNLYLIFYIGY